MVALTGIERVNSQFNSVQFGLSQCKYVQLVRRDLPETCYRLLACQRGHSQIGSESCLGPRITLAPVTGDGDFRAPRPRLVPRGNLPRLDGPYTPREDVNPPSVPRPGSYCDSSIT